VLLLLFADQGQAAGLSLEPPQLTAALVGTGAQTLVLCIRRRRPVLCIGLVAALQIALFAALPPVAAVRGVAPVIAAYGCGALLPARRATRVVACAVAAESVGLLVATAVRLGVGSEQVGSVVTPVAGQLLSGALTYAGGALLGAYIATRRQYVELVRVRAAEAVEAQRARADAAIGQERSRMARELHDIAAHHLSGMVVQSAVVERLIDRDPQAAKEAAAWIRAQGKETLHNLRLVVGALRGPAHGDDGELGEGGAPVPGLAVLDRLVQAARDLGTPVELVRDDGLPALPPIADVSFYRVAQEALANVREHAPGASARVVLRRDGSAVVLEVENSAVGSRPDGDGRRPGRGFGLAGMRERAQLIGAAFEAGPAPSGGWRVSLSLEQQTASPRAGADGRGPTLAP